MAVRVGRTCGKGLAGSEMFDCCGCSCHIAANNIIHRYSPLADAMSLPIAFPGQASEICPADRQQQQKSAKTCKVKPSPTRKDTAAKAAATLGEYLISSRGRKASRQTDRRSSKQ